MKKTVIANLLAIMVVAAPAFAGELENSAMSARLISPDLASVKELSLPAPVPAVAGSEKGLSVRSWTDDVKNAYTFYLDRRELSTLPEAKSPELPAAALKQLKKDNSEQNSWSPPYSAKAYKLMVRSQAAFVIQNERGGRGMTVHIFSAQGRLIAAGGADKTVPLHWDDLNAASSGTSHSGGGFDGPDYVPGSGPDAIDDGSGPSGSGGGPDDTDSGGCGGTGSGGGSDPDGSGGGVDF